MALRCSENLHNMYFRLQNSNTQMNTLFNMVAKIYTFNFRCKIKILYNNNSNYVRTLGHLKMYLNYTNYYVMTLAVYFT